MPPPATIFHAGHFAPYTNDPAASATVIFPSHGHQIMTTLLQSLGLSLVTWALSHRVMTLPWGDWDKMQDTKVPNILAVMVFAVSWAFIFAGSVLVTGAGLALNEITCAMAIYSCIILYAFSKILIYAFLIEKVWLVWRKDYKTGFQARWNNGIWRTGMTGLTLYIGILILMLVGKQAEIRPRDGVCVIGLTRFSSIPLLTFDLFITLALTSMFVRPLWAGKFPTPKLRNLAIKTVVSSGVALGTSAVNIAVLTVLHGKELGWVCLTSCGGDVTINALVLYIVTSGGEIKEAIPGASGAENKPSATPQPITDRKLLMESMRKNGLANNPLSPTMSLTLTAGRSQSISNVPLTPPTAPTRQVHFFSGSNNNGTYAQGPSSDSDLAMKTDPLGVEGGIMEDSQSIILRSVARLPNRPRIGSFSTTDSESKSPSMSTPASSGSAVFKSMRSRSESFTQLYNPSAEAGRPTRGLKNSISAVASRAGTGARNLVRNAGELLWGSRAEVERSGVQVTVTREEDLVNIEKNEANPTETNISIHELKGSGDDTETDSQAGRTMD
ncbi:hypothetical protein FRC04_005342 [Tulasnella sp. 424]|nr:hypothetical protein FRC04_005342 [Tulasnella sp. 424]KAG8976452.1 hypothetical protein FRC05_003695 [Tulasnella sp. 425]